MLSLAIALVFLGPPPAPRSPANPSDLAHTNDDTRIAIAPIAYSEMIPHHTRTAVRAALGEAVQKTVQNALLLDVDAECSNRDCAIRQAQDANAEFLIELRLMLEHRDYVIEVVVLAAEDARELGTAPGLCRLCGQAELLAQIATQIDSLRATLEPTRRAPSPQRPDQPLATTTRSTAAKPGAEIAGWISFTLGLAGVGAGAALTAIDGREHHPSCSAELRDINGACPNVYMTRPAGIVALGVGGAALATGAALLIASKARRKRGTSARVRPTSSGLSIEF